MKTTKKALALFLAVLTLFSCFTLAASAATTKSLAPYDNGELNCENWGKKKLNAVYIHIADTTWDKLEGGKVVSVYFSEADYDFNSPEELKAAVAEGKVTYVSDLISEENKSPRSYTDDNGIIYLEFSLYVKDSNLNQEGFYYFLLPEGTFSGYVNGTGIILSEEAVIGSYEFDKRNTTFIWNLICAYVDFINKLYSFFGIGVDV